MANSADPDEMASYKPSHLDLHCLQRYVYWSVGMKGLKHFLLYTKSPKYSSTDSLKAL